MIDGVRNVLRPLAMGLSAGLLLGQAAFSSAQESAPAQGEQPLVPLATFLDLNAATPDEQIQQLVQDLLAEAEESGSAAYTSVKQVEYLSLHEAVSRALEKNLALAIAGQNIPLAEEALLEAKAVFDPVFNVSVGYSRLNSSERRIRGFVEEKNVILFFGTGGRVDIPENPFLAPDEPQIVGIQFVTIFGRGVVLKDILVSQRSDNDPPQQTDYDISIQQQLPWGARFDVSLNMVDKTVFYNGRGNSFGADWTSNISGNLFLPLPYTKDFGPYSQIDVGIKLAAKETEASFWTIKQSINDILSATDFAYWALVGAIEELRVINDNRRLIEAQAEATNRLFEAQRITAFDKAQVDAELTRLQVEEEVARNAAIDAANVLASFITDSGEQIASTLLMPIAYGDHAHNALDLDQTDVFANGLRYRPELKVGQVNVEAAEIARRGAAVRTLPDLAFSATGNSRQKATKDGKPDSPGFGYRHLQDSLANITHPDSFGYTANLTYRYPWGNRALKAAHRQAKNFHEDQQLDLRERENRVRREVADALSGVFTARERVAVAEKEVDFASEAFEALISRRDKIGDVVALEVIRTSQAVLDARTELVRALIDHKIQEGQLLAAQGIIANQYAQVLARNAFEKNRLGLLAANDGLRFFAPISE